jgi:type 1 fimbria pilin
MLKPENNHFWGTFFLRHIMLLALFIAYLPVYAADNVTLNISGTLRKPVCQILPEDQSIDINFQTIIMKDLEQGSPTPAKPFVVRLKSCDIQAKEAKVTIKGIGAAGDNNLLALDSASTAKGVGIGFKQGQAMDAELPLNITSDGQALSEGDSRLYFGAYVQKLPSATLMEGTFSAIATLNIEYL